MWDQDRYQELFVRGPVPSLVTDADGSVVEANERASALLRVPAPALEGRQLREFVVADDHAELDHVLTELRAGREVDSRSLRVPTHEDGVSIMLTNVRALPDVADDTLSWVLVDVTESEQARAALQEAFAEQRDRVAYLTELDAWKDALLAAAGHDLRAPLAIARSAVEVLREQQLDEAQRRGITERVSRALARLDRLLLDLLDLDRLTRGTAGIQREPVELAEVVDEALAEVPTGTHDVAVDVEPGLVAELDRLRAQQLVANLVRNAVEHTPEGTNVTVAAAPADGGVCIVVEDDGPGIPEPIAEEVFAPFVSRPTGSGSTRGTGLGLSLVRLFAELHGGQVRLTRSGSGGARFEAVLPDA